MAEAPTTAPGEQLEVLARGPWSLEQITTHWHSEHFQPSPAHVEAADAAIRALEDRGSPSHDGVSARLLARYCCSSL